MGIKTDSEDLTFMLGFQINIVQLSKKGLKKSWSKKNF